MDGKLTVKQVNDYFESIGLILLKISRITLRDTNRIEPIPIVKWCCQGTAVVAQYYVYFDAQSPALTRCILGEHPEMPPQFNNFLLVYESGKMDLCYTN